jgi:hypothetical protein
MLNEIQLQQLVPRLRNCIAGMNLSFLQKLLIEISESQTPYTSRKLSEKLGVKWNEKDQVSPLIRAWFKGTRNIRIKHLEKLLRLSKCTWGDVEKELIFIKSGTNNGAIYLKFPISINDNLGKIIGYILGDGSIDKRFMQPFFTNQNKEVLKDFERQMFKCFGIKPRIWCQKPGNFKNRRSKWLKRLSSIDDIPEGMQGGLFYPKIIGLVLLSVFGKFSFGRHKEITKEILRTNRDFQAGLLKSFFESEGSVRLDGIGVYQDSRQVLENIRKILLNFGINPNPVNWYVKKNKIRYYFSITGYRNLEKFLKEIGFTSDEKIKKLKKVIIKLKNMPSPKLRKHETKKLILYMLKNTPNLSPTGIRIKLKEIHPNFKWNRKTIYRHMQDLTKKRLVVRTEHGYKLND